MATRRSASIKKEETPDFEDTPSRIISGPPKVLESQGIVPRSVIVKLALFTCAMIIAPLGSYYLSLNTIFSGNNTFAGATAAVVANIVLVGYIITALREDDASSESKKKK
ncbi:hypothetical protein BDZ91DRAFT_720469 [Kalaharituber pfeilii]|nr:hypothetical protein BDZ91DRAFT_720469 [Kalaharituber pfeilii]